MALIRLRDETGARTVYRTLGRLDPARARMLQPWLDPNRGSRPVAAAVFALVIWAALVQSHLTRSEAPIWIAGGYILFALFVLAIVLRGAASIRARRALLKGPKL